MIYLSNINLNQNELQNAVIQPLAVAPASPKLGQIYCDSTNSRIKFYNGTNWQVVGVVVESSETNGAIRVDGVEMTVYTLPVATTTKIGGIKVGTGLQIEADGTLSTNLGANLDNKVDKVEGKQLSTEDYTSAEKTKLAGITAGAEVNVQSDWSVTDTTSDAYINNKPTKLSDFTNDEDFIDNTVSNLANYYLKTETYSKDEVDTAIAGLALIDIVVPDNGTLPDTGDKNKIYLIPKTSGQTLNVYDEYIWTGTAFEKVGDTEIDLSNYLTKTGDASDVTVSFTTASTRENIATGDALDVIASKIAKYFGDLSDVAFSGSYDDLEDKPTLVKTQTATMTSVDGTQKIVTVTGEKILDVVLTDSTTHEILTADITINGLTATIKIATAYENGIDILVTYL